MENNHCQKSAEQDCIEFSSLIRTISSSDIDGFDTIKENHFSDQTQSNGFPSPGLSITGTGKADVRCLSNPAEPPLTEKINAAAINMPPSSAFRSPKKVNFGGKVSNSNQIPEIVSTEKKDTKFYSLQIPKGYVPLEVSSNTEIKNPKSDSRERRNGKFYSQPMQRGLGSMEANNSGVIGLNDRRYDSFKTWSGKLERRISNLRGRPLPESIVEDNISEKSENVEALPVDRYYDALQGPELETLKDSEEIVLPKDRLWPFLLRYPISSFGICLGVSSQAIMWKTIATSTSTHFLHASLMVNMVLWFFSISLMAVVASTYILKMLFYFEAVCREYYHPIRVNYFFTPWIALLYLVQGVPPAMIKNIPHAFWYVLMTPILILEVKIYGQWMSGGQRRLSKVANPSNHLAVVGNFVGAALGASMGLKEAPIFFFAVGLAHFIVLFVTLYQRLPTNEALPKELHPVFFLFVAAPTAASTAWAAIQESFDYGSRIAYFIGLFLYISLAVRINFFRGFRFSLAWWAYTTPMTGAAIATLKYSNEFTNAFTQALSIVLCVISTLVITAVLVTTILHAFVLGDLFPNDIAIAISDKKPMQHRKWFHLRRGGSDKDIEHCLKFVSLDDKGIAEAVEPLSSDVKRV